MSRFTNFDRANCESEYRMDGSSSTMRSVVFVFGILAPPITSWQELELVFQRQNGYAVLFRTKPGWKPRTSFRDCAGFSQSAAFRRCRPAFDRAVSHSEAIYARGCDLCTQ